MKEKQAKGLRNGRLDTGTVKEHTYTRTRAAFHFRFPRYFSSSDKFLKK